ncbi:hypothetical protein FQN50_002737 [Emmonsiellopsis sp. PD_5]|nr:hypothetical protein FQN50_002737 [Emmonsiellopsis sp. PD_5]
MRHQEVTSGSGNAEPSETSPLLGNGPKASPNPAISGGDEEAVGQNEADSAREAQYSGLPEAQKKLKYIVPAVSIGIFLSASDQTIIVSSYGKIGSDLQALNLTSWIATSYFLTLTSFQPLYGRLSDIFGRKSCLLFAYGVFGTGCIFCGLARDINELIAARVFQGIGGGGMTTVVSIIMSDIVPLRDRGVWQGVINIVYATGSAVGAPLGKFSFLNPLALNLGLANASPQDQAVATACSYLFRSLGSVIGLSLGATVLQQSLRNDLRSTLGGNKDIDKIVAGVRQSLDFINTLDPKVRTIVRECYGRATNYTFVFMTIVVFFALFSAFFIRETKLSR